MSGSSSDFSHVSPKVRRRATSAMNVTAQPALWRGCREAQRGVPVSLINGSIRPHQLLELFG